MAGPFTPNTFSTPEGPRPNAGYKPGTGSFSTALIADDRSLNLPLVLALSVLFHLLAIGFVALVFFLLSIFGFFKFTLIHPKPNDVEFQLIDSPTEKPRDPNTKNRAEHNSRSGGQRVPHLREAQSMRRSGAPRPKQATNPSPERTKPTQQQQPAARPVPVQRPRPVRQAQQQPARQAPARQTTQSVAPPRRTTTRSTAPQRTRVAAIPNPLAPVRVPDAKGPVGDTGPVVRGPAGGGRSGGSAGTSGAMGPATAPGQFSGGGRPAGGGPSGEGGRGRFSQYGSPGGGGGRAGIDAKADPDFGSYIAELQRRIRRNWRPPDDREDKTVILKFTVGRDGRLLGITTKRTSGFADADGAARHAVENAAPFRPLPPEYSRNSIDVEFTFDYNVFKNGGGGRLR